MTSVITGGDHLNTYRVRFIPRERLARPALPLILFCGGQELVGQWLAVLREVEELLERLLQLLDVRLLI